MDSWPLAAIITIILAYLMIGVDVGFDIYGYLAETERGDHGHQNRAEIRHMLHRQNTTPVRAAIRAGVLWPQTLVVRRQARRTSKES